MKTLNLIQLDQKNCCRLIGVMLLLKILAMGFFSSDYQDKLFFPFVEKFLSGENPYAFFVGSDVAFPYFPVMLWIESLGGLLVKIFSPQSIFLQNFFFKVPLLIFDALGFFYLLKIKCNLKYATVFYFCSPIIFYAAYMHGQLDIIPTTLFTIAVYWLLDWKEKNNLLYCAIFLGLALSCKAHLWAAVPILFFYIAKKKSYKKSIGYLAISLAILILSCVGFWSDGFVKMVLFNKEQASLMNVTLNYGAVQLALPIVILGLIYLDVYELNYFNKNLFISILGFLFTIFLICISPMPAWFIWAVPFYVLYFCFAYEEKYRSMIVYAAFNALYLIYFIFFHKTKYTDISFLGTSWQFLKIENHPTMQNFLFALMVICLISLVYKIYHVGIASNNLYRLKSNSFVIGIAGDSGAGKTRLLEKIENLFSTDKDVLFIEGDGDHRWERNDEHWEQYTALNPQANYLYKQAEDIRRLKNGDKVVRVEYDHDTGKFTKQHTIYTKKFLVLCGLHSLYLPFLRDELDLKIFMDTETELRNFWKISRDTAKRGYSKEKILAQIQKRIPDAEKYIYPQKQYADIVITYFDKTLKNCLEENHEVELSVKFLLSINYDFEKFLKSFEEFHVFPKQRICDDFLHQEIIFDGKEIMQPIDFEKIAEKNISQYEDFFTYSPAWGNDVEGIIQIVLLVLISEKMKG